MSDLNTTNQSKFNDFIDLKNLIIFGAPGTGKSYMLKSATEDLFVQDCIERVTFHPDYSYANFVGAYKPAMLNKANSGSLVDETKLNEIIHLFENIKWEQIVIVPYEKNGQNDDNAPNDHANHREQDKLVSIIDKGVIRYNKSYEDFNSLVNILRGITDENFIETIILHFLISNEDDLKKFVKVKTIAECKSYNKVLVPFLIGLYSNEEKCPFPKNNNLLIFPDYYSNYWKTGRDTRSFIYLRNNFIKSYNSDVEYKFVPGPFMRTYVKAKNDPDNNYVLIIEEINRANVAAVFGDLFQLLDRNSNGSSEYPIQASEDIKNYLVENGITETSLSIPSNLYIWSTMNSADQGVFPIDTAFKRRWNFVYLGIDDNDDEIQGKFVHLNLNNGQKQIFEWNRLRKAINNYLVELNINEDKQLGPFFINLQSNNESIYTSDFERIFKSKVLMYLFEDAAKQKRSSLFAGCGNKYKRYSDICDEFDSIGINIFNNDIVSQVF